MEAVTLKACPRCFALAFAGRIRAETVMPIPELGPPLSIEDCGEHSPVGSPICHDCQAAENLAKFTVLAAWVATEPGGIKGPCEPKGMDFRARRVVVGNERQEQLRLPPDLRPHFGLVRLGLVLKSEDPDDYEQVEGDVYDCPALKEHHAWLETVGIKLGEAAGADELLGARFA